MLFRIAASFWLLAAAYGATPRPLADVPIQTADIRKIDLKQYRGKVVLLALISTECIHCVQSIEILNRAQKDFGPRGFQVISAAIEENAAYKIGAFASRYRPAFPLGYLDREDAIKIADIPKDMRPFVPILMFIDRKGTVRYQFHGDHQVMRQEKQEEQTIRGIAGRLLIEGSEKSAPKAQAAAKRQ